MLTLITDSSPTKTKLCALCSSSSWCSTTYKVVTDIERWSISEVAVGIRRTRQLDKTVHRPLRETPGKNSILFREVLWIFDEDGWLVTLCSHHLQARTGKRENTEGDTKLSTASIGHPYRLVRPTGILSVFFAHFHSFPLPSLLLPPPCFFRLVSWYYSNAGI